MKLSKIFDLPNFFYMWGPSVILIFVLAGCAVMDKLPDKFDSMEYSELVRLNLISEQTTCSVEDIKQAYKMAAFLEKYSEHRMNANNQEIYDQIFDIVAELENREAPSDAYCRIKWQNINNITDTALEVSGKRSR
jgi:hypothetical protein